MKGCIKLRTHFCVVLKLCFLKLKKHTDGVKGKGYMLELDIRLKRKKSEVTERISFESLKIISPWKYCGKQVISYSCFVANAGYILSLFYPMFIAVTYAQTQHKNELLNVTVPSKTDSKV